MTPISPDRQAKQPGARRWGRSLSRFFGVLLFLAVAIYFTRDFWADNLRALFIGRMYVLGEKYGRLLPPVDEIEIMALGGKAPEGTPDSFPNDMEEPLGTVNRSTIRGAEAESLAALWRDITFDRYFSGLCHHPYYALRFRHHGKLVLETSVCWECRNVTLPYLGNRLPFQYGFDARSEDGQKLLAKLSGYAPHPSPSK